MQYNAWGICNVMKPGECNGTAAINQACPSSACRRREVAWPLNRPSSQSDGWTRALPFSSRPTPASLTFSRWSAESPVMGGVLLRAQTGQGALVPPRRSPGRNLSSLARRPPSREHRTRTVLQCMLLLGLAPLLSTAMAIQRDYSGCLSFLVDTPGSSRCKKEKNSETSFPVGTVLPDFQLSSSHSVAISLSSAFSPRLPLLLQTLAGQSFCRTWVSGQLWTAYRRVLSRLRARGQPISWSRTGTAEQRQHS